MSTPAPDPTMATPAQAPEPSPRHADRRSATRRRADAQRNRQRILTAARALYAAQGLGVSMAAVARDAGVGKATLSRHFATPQHLIDAVFLEHMDDYVRVTNQALAVQDPWQGFVEYICNLCQLQAGNRGFADVLTLTVRGDGAVEQRRLESFDGFVTLIRRAKATGRLREDFASEDLVLLLMANAGLISATARDAPQSWRRLVGQLLRAFATPGSPLPPLDPAPSSDLLFQAMARLGDRAGGTRSR